MSISENTTSLETVLSSVSTLVSGDKKYVSFIKTQTLTEQQKLQARDNIGVYDEIYIGDGSMPEGAVLQLVLEDDDDSGYSLEGAVLHNQAQTLTDEQKAQACKNIGIPTATVADAGKFVRVSSVGTLVIESIPDAEEVAF